MSEINARVEALENVGKLDEKAEKRKENTPEGFQVPPNPNDIHVGIMDGMGYPGYAGYGGPVGIGAPLALMPPPGSMPPQFGLPVQGMYPQQPDYGALGGMGMGGVGVGVLQPQYDPQFGFGFPPS